MRDVLGKANTSLFFKGGKSFMEVGWNLEFVSRSEGGFWRRLSCVRERERGSRSLARSSLLDTGGAAEGTREPRRALLQRDSLSTI